MRPSLAARLLARVVAVEPGEIAALLWATAYFFALLAAYYLIKPLRDTLGLAGGTRNLPWLFQGTLLAVLVANPLFSALVSRFPRRRFIPYVYRFFELNLLAFFVVLLVTLPRGDGGPTSAHVVTARAFYIWTSVFNLFVISVFWGFMADCFTSDQGKRLFGFIAVGGTLGAIAGSNVTANLPRHVDPVYLALASIVLLELAVLCATRLGRIAGAPGAPAPPAAPAPPTQTEPELARGGAFGGILHTLASPYLLGICGYMLLFTVTQTFLYLEQARIIEQTFSGTGDRLRFLGRIELYVNCAAVLLQVLLTGRIIRAIGVGPTAAVLPAVTIGGFLALARAPSPALLTLVQVVRRSADYAVARPAREVFFTVVRRDQKYKAKSFIDTFVYRGGDALGAGVSGVVKWLGGGLEAMAVIAAPLCAIWAGLALVMGWAQQRRARQTEPLP